MTSPSDPSRTMRTLERSVTVVADSRSRYARAGRAWNDPWVADDGDAPAVGTDDVALGHGVDGVVGALAMDVRMQQLEQRTHGGFGKDDDEVHAAKRRHELGPMLGRQHGTPLPLQRPYRLIVVDRHDQADPPPALPPRGIARDRRAADRSSRWRTRPCGRRARLPTRATSASREHDFTHEHASSPARPVDIARSERTARRISSADAVAVPRFMTTIPPA